MLALAGSALAFGTAQAQEPTPPPRNWAISVFVGSRTDEAFIQSIYSLPEFHGDYLVGADLTYKFYQTTVWSYPIDLELDVTAGKRFGVYHQWDFGIVPMVRWKYFPWNDHLYTNVRLGLLGLDYVTGTSPWELHWAGNNHGSRVLNDLAFEVDFRTSEASPLEWYVGAHHRSGIGGVINRTFGGSSYMLTGLRYIF